MKAAQCEVFVAVESRWQVCSQLQGHSATPATQLQGYKLQKYMTQTNFTVSERRRDGGWKTVWLAYCYLSCPTSTATVASPAVLSDFAPSAGSSSPD